MSEISTHGALFKPGATITPAIRKAAENTRAKLLADLKAVTPVRSGRLSSGWSVKLAGNGLEVSNQTPYATYVEMGTKRMPGRHMLGQTLPRAQRHFRVELAKQVGQELGTKITAGVEVGLPSGNDKLYEALTGNLQSYLGRSRGFRQGNAVQRFLSDRFTR